MMNARSSGIVRAMRNVRGLVAAELLLSLTLVGLVAAAAVPAVDLLAARSHHAERVEAVTSLDHAMQDYFKKKGNYPPCCGWRDPPGAKAGTPAPWNPSLGGWRALLWSPGAEEVNYRYQFWSWGPDERAPDSYLIEAVGDSDHNGVESYYWEVWTRGHKMYAGNLRPEE